MLAADQHTHRGRIGNLRRSTRKKRAAVLDRVLDGMVALIQVGHWDIEFQHEAFEWLSEKYGPPRAYGVRSPE